MAQNYIHTLFTDTVRLLQKQDGSRDAYARMEEGATGLPDLITQKECAFIAARDSFYIASITRDGWPYMQHRGGPAGFLKTLPDNQIGFADYRGNRQHISTANLINDSRVSLFLMDYINRRRLKILGHARVVGVEEDSALITSLMPENYAAVPERAYLIDVIGYDWNCPQHIMPRFTESEVAEAIRPVASELKQLRAEVEMLRSNSATKEQS
jgi:uncharacterized protein